MTPDIADIIAGELKVSRGTAYDMMREALKEASPVEPVAEVQEVWSDPSKVTAIVMHGNVLNCGDKLYTTPPAAQRQWVSVNDRPPDERTLCLVLIDEQVHVASFDPRMESAKWWSAYGIPYRLTQVPTHWMPLPEAPAAQRQYPLPDDLYDSKDWKEADYAGRVEWLHTMYESNKQTLEAYTAAPVQEPVATKLETQQFNCFHVSAEDFQRLKALPVGAKLYTNPPAAQPSLQTCNCRWDGETLVQQCTLHQSHVDAIHEWAERAKSAEQKLAAQRQPLTPEWISGFVEELRDSPAPETDFGLVDFVVRKVEAAHGITKGGTP